MAPGLVKKNDLLELGGKQCHHRFLLIMLERLKLVGPVHIFPNAAVGEGGVVISTAVTIGGAKECSQINAVITRVLESNVGDQTEGALGPV